MRDLWWRDEDAEHIRTRSTRYPGALDIEPAWTLEAATDPHRVVRDPDPRSQTRLRPHRRLLAQRRVRHHGCRRL